MLSRMDSSRMSQQSPDANNEVIRLAGSWLALDQELVVACVDAAVDGDDLGMPVQAGQNLPLIARDERERRAAGAETVEFDRVPRRGAIAREVGDGRARRRAR